MRLEIGDYSFNFKRRLRILFFKSPWLAQACRFVIGYTSWIIFIRFIYISLVTYFSISPQSRFQDVSDSIYHYSMIMAGVSAALFIILLIALRPLVRFDWREFYQPHLLEREWLKGFFKGALLVGLFCIPLLFLGYYKFVGFYLHATEAPLEFFHTTLRVLSIIILTYAEGYLFFIKFPHSLKEQLPHWIIAQGVALFYCLAQYLQFDLGLFHAISLYGVALSLYARSLLSGTFYQGAGFWAAILILFNPLFSLPIFGSEHFGILILKPDLNLAGDISPHWITGGLRGPICSPIFQIFLLFDFIKSMMKYRTKSQTGTH